MKVNFGFLLPLAVLAAGAFVAPAQANPTGDRPTVTPTIVAQRGERSMQASQSKPMLQGNNYVGLAGSEEGAVVNGRYALSNRFSIRPEVFTNLGGDNGEEGVAVLAPVTLDFNGSNGDRTFQPFAGMGPGVRTGDSTELQFVTTAGADIQLGKRYAINGSVNYLPFDDQQVDFVAGLGYRF